METSLAKTSGAQSLMGVLDINTKQLARRFDSESNYINRRAEVLEVSVFEGDSPATQEDINKQVVLLQSVWRDMPELFWGTLKYSIKESGISAERLRFAVSQFLQTHTYNKSFTPAELISIDKKIIVARSLQSLRSKVRFQMEWEDIAIVEMFQERRFVLMDDAKMYNLHILAVYHHPGIIEWVGKYDSPAFHQRRKAFETAVMKFVKFYPEQMCKEFFEYWSEPQLCGDVMRCETTWSQDCRRADGTHDNMIEEYIDDWAVEHGYESQYQPIKSNESES
jgi:hypothetical protein